MNTTGIRHCVAAAYNSQSNGCAERGVGQIKNLLEKMGRKGVLNQDELNKMVFKLNSHVTSGQGSALERFFGRNVGTYQIELVKRRIDHAMLIAKREEAQKKTAEKLGRRSKDEFKVGDKVLCQDMRSLKWVIKGEILEGRTADDGSVRSFVIRTERGRNTIRNSRHIKFQAAKRVSFYEPDGDSGVSCPELSSDSDDTAENGLETEPRRASARLAALAAQ